MSVEGAAPVPAVDTSCLNVCRQVLRYQRTDGLKPKPYRNSGIDLANGVLDGSVAAGVFAQPWPTAHRLAQCSRAGPLPSLGDGHIGDSAQGTADDQAHLRRGQQVRRDFQELPQPLYHLQGLHKSIVSPTHILQSFPDLALAQPWRPNLFGSSPSLPRFKALERSLFIDCRASYSLIERSVNHHFQRTSRCAVGFVACRLHGV